MPRFSNHTRGFLITFIGVLILTPDALLFRLVNTDLWTMAFLRGSLMPASLLLIFLSYYRGQTLRVILNIGSAGLIVALLSLCSNMAFVTALTYTTVAKTLIMLACIPIFTALFSWFFLKEKLNSAGLLTLVTSFTGVCIVVAESISSTVVSNDLTGDIAALLTALFWAAIFVYLRRHKEVNMIPAFALGWLSMALISLPFAQPFLLNTAQLSAAMLMGLIVLPVSFGLIMIGPRCLPAPEVSLLMLLETALGPLWVWLVIHEQPSVNTLIGGTIVVVSIATYSIWQLANIKSNSTISS